MKGAKLIFATDRTLTRMGARPLFDEGLYELGRDTYAWLVPNGSWGETNIGLVRCGDQTVLIDTCWDLYHTREMLGHADRLLRGAPVHAIINTHADGDHCWGNQLFAGRPICSTRACADQIHHQKPIQLTALQWSSKLFSGISTNGVDALGRRHRRSVGRLDAVPHVTARWADVPDGGSTSQPDRIERANSERSAIL